MMSQTQMHLVQLSPWPLTMSLGILSIMTSTVFWFNYNSPMFLIVPTIILITSAFAWWRDVIRESAFQGHHNSFVQMGLASGMVIFIATEIMFFSSFFWMFFHVGLIPTQDIGMLWPSMGIHYLNPFSVPLLNTGILLISGVSITWAHHAMMKNNKTDMVWGIILGVALGVIFTSLQWMEYKDTNFDLTDSTTGSAMFVATGFHGAHVMVGSIFLTVMAWRSKKNQFSMDHFMGFEMAAWYWHFVDVVWLYLFICMYWWLGH